jgi:hypothetical protein
MTPSAERWQTPPEIFDPLMAEFSFDLDAAADGETRRVPRYLCDALSPIDWPGARIWMNPPYGRKLEPFVRRAADEADKGKLIVALIPFRCRAALESNLELLETYTVIICVNGNALFAPGSFEWRETLHRVERVRG